MRVIKYTNWYSNELLLPEPQNIENKRTTHGRHRRHGRHRDKETIYRKGTYNFAKL